MIGPRPQDSPIPDPAGGFAGEFWFASLRLGAAGPRVGDGPDCFDEATVAALAEEGGALDAEARSALLPHLATCARCRAAVASVARALGDGEVAREIAAASGGRGRRWYRVALPLAAAAMLVVLAWPRGPDEEPARHRAPTITATAAPVPESPVGTVAAAAELRWGEVAGADRYRVTLFDAGGRVLYETQLIETELALPDSVVLVPGRIYLWKVEARSGWDRWSESSLVQFSIASPPPPRVPR
jgi:hypothetical protein